MMIFPLFRLDTGPQSPCHSPSALRCLILKKTHRETQWNFRRFRGLFCFKRWGTTITSFSHPELVRWFQPTWNFVEGQIGSIWSCRSLKCKILSKTTHLLTVKLQKKCDSRKNPTVLISINRWWWCQKALVFHTAAPRASHTQTGRFPATQFHLHCAHGTCEHFKNCRRNTTRYQDLSRWVKPTIAIFPFKQFAQINFQGLWVEKNFMWTQHHLRLGKTSHSFQHFVYIQRVVGLGIFSEPSTVRLELKSPPCWKMDGNGEFQPFPI